MMNHADSHPEIDRQEERRLKKLQKQAAREFRRSRKTREAAAIENELLQAMGAGRRSRLRRYYFYGGLLLTIFLFLLPPYVIPVDGRVTSRFFLRQRPESWMLFDVEMHQGMDLAAAEGTVVRSAKGGRVLAAGWSDTLGNYAVVQHWFGFSTIYGHMSSLSVRQGTYLLKWGEIGRVGATGRATGSHLHFEVKWGRHSLPPGMFLSVDYLRRWLFGLLLPY